MKEFSTHLTDSQRERLSLLTEECAEVIQIISKIQRHGFNSYHPVTLEGNREKLIEEIADILYSLSLLDLAEDIDMDKVFDIIPSKAIKKKKYLHFQDEQLLDQLCQIIGD